MTKVLTNPTGGRRWVVSDIHGCFKTFKAIVEKRIELTKADQLFLLGDYINRGKDSARVLDYIIHLIQQEYQKFPLRGNHEQKLLNAWPNRASILGFILISVDSNINIICLPGCKL